MLAADLHFNLPSWCLQGTTEKKRRASSNSTLWYNVADPCGWLRASHVYVLAAPSTHSMPTRTANSEQLFWAGFGHRHDTAIPNRADLLRGGRSVTSSSSTARDNFVISPWRMTTQTTRQIASVISKTEPGRLESHFAAGFHTPCGVQGCL